MLLPYLALLCLASVFAVEPEEWKADNFLAKAGQHATVLVMFYAPWCGHCKRMHPEFNMAADSLAKVDTSIKLAKVNCDENGDFCQQHKVSGYPTLKVFKNGKFDHDYNGERQKDDFVSYMLLRSRPQSTELKLSSDYEHFIKNALPAVVAYIKLDDDFLTEYMDLASALIGKVSFAHTHDASLMDVPSDKSSVLLVRPTNLQSKFEASKILYSGSLNKDDLKSWIFRNGHGLMGYRTASTIEFFRSGDLLVFYHNATMNENPSMVKYYRNRVVSAFKKAKTEDSGLKLAYSPSGEFRHEMMEFGLETAALPVVGIRSSSKKYQLAEYTMDSLVRFLEDYKSGSLSPYLKSEPIPTDESGPVKVVVGLNFDEVVNNPAKDVFIMFHAPWCGHCKKLQPIFNEAAEKLKDEHEIVFASMDATANDVPAPYTVTGFPTLYFVPKLDKANPRNYAGTRTLEDLVKYVAQQSTNELIRFDRLGNEKKTDL